MANISISLTDELKVMVDEIIESLSTTTSKYGRSDLFQVYLNGIAQGTVIPLVNKSIQVGSLVINREGFIVEGDSHVEVNRPENSSNHTLQQEILNLKKEIDDITEINKKISETNNKLQEEIEDLKKQLKDCHDGCGCSGQESEDYEIQELKRHLESTTKLINNIELLKGNDQKITEITKLTGKNIKTYLTNGLKSMSDADELSDEEINELIDQVFSSRVVLNDEVIFEEKPLESEVPISPLTRVDNEYYFFAHLNGLVNGVLPCTTLSGDLYTNESIRARQYFNIVSEQEGEDIGKEIDVDDTLNLTTSVAKELSLLILD